MSPTLGMKLRAKSDRIFEYAGHEPLVLWRKNQVLTVSGLVQHPGQPLEVLFDLDDKNWEAVPLPILDEYFEPAVTH